MSNHGTILKQGEKESRTSQVVNDVVTLHHVTEHKKLGQVVMDWSFNFADVSHEKIIELASRSLVIDQRNAWKKLTATEASSSESTKQMFNVSELIVKQKRGKTDAQRVAALFDGKSAEEIEAMIKLATS